MFHQNKFVDINLHITYEGKRGGISVLLPIPKLMPNCYVTSVRLNNMLTRSMLPPYWTLVCDAIYLIKFV